MYGVEILHININFFYVIINWQFLLSSLHVFNHFKDRKFLNIPQKLFLMFYSF
jgi:hypothetical protein